MCVLSIFFFFKHKTAYELRISDWSSDVCSSDLDDRTDAFGDRVLDRMAHASGHGDAGDDHRVDARGAQETRKIGAVKGARPLLHDDLQIGRASCRERVCQYV